MMNGFTDLLDRILSMLLLPATIYGAGGAIMNAKYNKKPIKQAIIEIIGGALTAHMMAPVVVAYTPEAWHSVCFFFVGFGGLGFVGQIYEVAAKALEHRVKKKIGGE